MSPIDHFSHGLTTPMASYVMSSLGCALGLLLTSRARIVDPSSARWWLLGGAFAIGGTGVWTMHFTAMMGFSVKGTAIRYNVPLTIVSALLAIVVVFAGLMLVHTGKARIGSLLGGGTLTGLGVAGMHYLGMAAMNMSAQVNYDPMMVVLSVLIGVVASTVALWFAMRVSGALAVVGAALIMGI